MEDALMSGIPEALVIWLALLGASLAAFGVLAAIAGRARKQALGPDPVPLPAHAPRIAITRLALAIAKEDVAKGHATKGHATKGHAAKGHAALDHAEPVRPRPEPTGADDERRFAEEVATAAARAAVTADRRHGEWTSAQRAVEAAWQAYETADRAARRAIKAAAFPTPATPLTAAEYAARELHLHRAAQAAHARGELSTDQLIDAMSHRNGFDPRMHPFEQDAMLRRIARDRLLRVYLTASDLERTAWREAEVAMAARASLDREATDAARRVRQTHHRPARTRVLAGRPHLAMR
jgi:hypothetical protein